MGDQEPMGGHIILGSSDMARRMRVCNWSATSLGPVENWPKPLLTAVSICLDCAFPIVIWWGPELAILYNDEYRTFLGPTKDPTALGERGAKVWEEIWDVIAPMLSHVVETGEATRSRDLLLHIDRQGYPEEAYFSFSYSPIYEETGKVGGIFCPVIETTERVIGERRLRTLRDLAASCVAVDSEHTVYRAAASVLEANLHDIPFSLIYRIDEEKSVAELQCSAGIAAGGRSAPRVVRLDADDPAIWSLGSVARTGKASLMNDLGARFPRLPTGAWPTPPASALALPVLLPGQERPRAILVAAVSPMRSLDADYRTFFGLVATQIASGLADAQAIEAERRRVEALAEIDRAKTAFFSNVSHEFRTPLTLMVGPLDDLLADPIGTMPAETRAMLSVVQRNSRRLLKLVNTLLDFARIEAGRVDASYEPTDLSALTTELASVFRSAIEKAGLQLRVECPALPEPVYVDRDMWEKIVLNLLSNAFKFTFEGTITVTLQRRGNQAELSVSDTGAGIAPADLPRMFERFHRVKNARSRTHEGTGIGLALVQELARLHGGEASVQSTEGTGSTFVVAIPLGSAHLPQDRIGAPRQLASTALSATPYVEEALRWLPPSTAQRAESPVVTVEDGGVPLQPRPRDAKVERILVVDDNADMRDYLKRLLSSTYAVAAVADGQAALERIAAQRPDLVLTDVMMPRLDGFGLLAALRAGESTRSLPVIMLSARAGEEARIDGLKAGADAYLIKPFSARELMARVSSQLELSRLRREVEQELRSRGEQFVTLFNQAPLGVYLVDADFRIREVNPIALPVFGDIPGGVIGRDFDEIIYRMWERPYADEIVRIFRHTLETGESYIEPERGETRIDRGVTEYYEWRLDRIALPDGTYGAVCYFRDVSAQVHARKLIEEGKAALEAADRRKNEFLATLAHELRNPLAAIGNSIYLLRRHRDGGSDDVRQMFERQVKHLVRLVDDLLDVSRITRGKIELRKEQVDVCMVLRSAIETASPLIEQRRHQLDVSLPDESLIVEADPVRLSQVFANLLNNAAKYTDDGGHIRLAVRRDDQRITVTVRDDGIGIPADMLPKVFDLFMQIDHSYSRSRGGLGIGLTLARDLVRMHGGGIEANSGGVGAGSEFAVTLPLLKIAPISSIGPSRDDAPAPRIEQRILVVEDDPDASESLRLLLAAMGAEVRTASSGPAALKLLDAYRPTVVILDIGMPDMDGYEVARRMRASADSGRVTIVALSGWGQEEDRRRSREAGIDHHLVKPVDVGTLERLLAAVGEDSGQRVRTLAIRSSGVPRPAAAPDGRA